MLTLILILTLLAQVPNGQAKSISQGKSTDTGTQPNIVAHGRSHAQQTEVRLDLAKQRLVSENF